MSESHQGCTASACAFVFKVKLTRTLSVCVLKVLAHAHTLRWSHPGREARHMSSRDLSAMTNSSSSGLRTALLPAAGSRYPTLSYLSECECQAQRAGGGRWVGARAVWPSQTPKPKSSACLRIDDRAGHHDGRRKIVAVREACANMRARRGPSAGAGAAQTRTTASCNAPPPLSLLPFRTKKTKRM